MKTAFFCLMPDKWQPTFKSSGNVPEDTAHTFDCLVIFMITTSRVSFKSSRTRETKPDFHVATLKQLAVTLCVLINVSNINKVIPGTTIPLTLLSTQPEKHQKRLTNSKHETGRAHVKLSNSTHERCSRPTQRPSGAQARGGLVMCGQVACGHVTPAQGTNNCHCSQWPRQQNNTCQQDNHHQDQSQDNDCQEPFEENLQNAEDGFFNKDNFGDEATASHKRQALKHFAAILNVRDSCVQSTNKEMPMKSVSKCVFNPTKTDHNFSLFMQIVPVLTLTMTTHLHFCMHMKMKG